VLPPATTAARDYQLLHIDFGLPVRPLGPVDVARFTALHVDGTHPPTRARTRLVPLRSLLGRRSWVEPSALHARVRRGDAAGPEGGSHVEGVLARLVEDADASHSLPPIGSPDFLCGMEFASVLEERARFHVHGLDLEAVEERVLINPGDLLLFDNLAIAHGRTGVRSPGELRQLCAGYTGLDVARQDALLRRVLAAFD